MGNPHICYDYSDNVTDGSFDASSCTGSGGTWTANAPCSHVNATVGCRHLAAGTVASCDLITYWDYAPLTQSCDPSWAPVAP
jgi:hypothetical protein